MILGRTVLCALCGSGMNQVSLCLHHGQEYGDEWADGNRAACDFFHRGRCRSERDPLTIRERAKLLGDEVDSVVEAFFDA